VWIVTNAELLSQLENAKNNLVLGMAGAAMLARSDVVSMLRSSSVSFGGFSVDLEQVGHMMSNEADQKIAIREYVLGNFRALIKESFELIKAYCGETGQHAKFKAAASYDFWRLVRNSLSHDAHWRFSDNDLNQVLPITWNGRVLDASMKDQPLTLDFIGLDGLYEIHREMTDFAGTNLS
jgi:hypothetical protein